MTELSPPIEQCRRILEELYDKQSNSSSDEIVDLLGQFRVLTREKNLTSDIVNEKCLKTLVIYASAYQTEAQKCLSNLILNYAHVREQLVGPYVDCVEKRLQRLLDEPLNEELATTDAGKVDEGHVNCEVLYYDLRIIFLLSALCSSSRETIRDRLFSLLIKVTLSEAKQFREENHPLVIESLKTLFNLTMERCLDINLVSELIIKLFSCVEITTRASTAPDNDKSNCDHTDQLLVNLIHLLTNMPEEVYVKLSDDDVDKVLRHLDNQLKTFTKNSFRETVLPVLNTCANICRFKTDVRQRWFQEIIGSTKDFEKRPEEYDTLRGRLVKLMTSVDIHIKDIAAEFLHALCGGDTEKFITYTGFGNSAAFLSTKGLLAQNATGSSLKPNDGSNLDEQSTTEITDRDYRELRGKLDPITGKLDQPKKDPMKGMTDEEKEWHAHELAGAIAKLSNLGVIKPMQVGSNGALKELRPGEVEEAGLSSKDDESV